MSLVTSVTWSDGVDKGAFRSATTDLLRFVCVRNVLCQSDRLIMIFTP